MAHMVAPHAVRPEEGDIIFGLAKRAEEKAAIIGKENVINATIGTLMDDNGKLVAFETVFSLFKGLDNADMAAYAEPAGNPAFLEAAIDACFLAHRPKGHIRAVATPGGTGAIRHSFANFTSPGDTIITANWYWAPYMNIANEAGRKLVAYNMFNDKKEFDYEAYEEAFESTIDTQKRLLTLFNTPSHNPTGYSITNGEWDKIIALAVKHAQDPEKRVVFLVDVAYIDFAGDDSRSFFEKFSDLPENILLLVAYSTSKSYTMYGLRNGALIAVSPSEDVVREFYYSCAHSNRGTWSNGTSGAMAVITKIYNDKDLYKQVEEERDFYRGLLAVRGKAFMDAAIKAEIPVTNYKGGYFASVEHPDPKALTEKLIEKNLFTVPLQKGIRIAICAVTEEDAAKIPVLIKEAL
ncbi:MAG: aminotransferase class I/II-fold pyridoxal phosphate-dependent enzyme [Eubacteriaceae bacterium]|nr:aminotransferase class I/II-fold pyridoxal phosphate-dependent enzyme [Eubacteriaceae bacterium]